MHDQPRGPLAIPDDVIRSETGRPSESWYILLDASGARAFSHAHLIEHLQDIYGLDARWAGNIAVRYEVTRGIDREVTVPSDLLAAVIFKSTARIRFEQMARSEQRSLLVWLDQATDAAERKARIGDLIDRLQRGDNG